MRNKGAILFAAAPAAFLLFFSLSSRLMQSEAETPENSPVLRRRETNAPSAAPKVVAVDAKTQKYLVSLVAGQLNAVRKRDYRAAMSFSAPFSHHEWRPDSFGRMIEAGFPVMIFSSTQRCQTARTTGAAATMLVRMSGAKEDSEGACIYSFGRMKDKWYITGCSPVIAPEPVGPGAFAASQRGRPGGDLPNVPFSRRDERQYR